MERIIKIRSCTKKILCLIILLSVILYPLAFVTKAADSPGMNDKRACWISFLDIESYLKDLDEKAFRDNVSEMYDNIKANHMNTVLVHVRAFGDAIYPSEYFPQAEYIASYRRILEYDPLDIMVSLAHERNMKIEAWINPYRLSKDNETTASYKDTEYYELYKDFIIEYTTTAGETALSLDPSREETVNLIADGVEEIIDNYAVDGIHFDDYFYMPGMGDNIDIQTRKLYVNNMVSTIYQTVKKCDENCEFGISPAGNLENAREQGADIDTWMSSPGYVDYIMPQIYWSDSYQTDSGITAMYSDRCREWQAINKRDIPIYVGLALYRVGEKSGSDLGWSQSDNNLATQYEIAYALGYDGYALFRYAWLENPVASTELQNLSVYAGSLKDGYVYDKHSKKDSGIEEIPGMQEKLVSDSFVSYSGYFGDKTWKTAVSDAEILHENSNIMHTVRMALGERAGQGDIFYRVYLSGAGWQPWTGNGACAGDLANKSMIQGIQIKLTGVVAENYDVYYRVACGDMEWLSWTKNGKTAGIPDYGRPVTGIQVLLVPYNDFMIGCNHTINIQ
ncbi:MAG: family 10 glycosylhydrolase [Wujia sp.]